MAPQVGLEPTTLRLTGGEEPFTTDYYGCMYASLIKGLCPLQQRRRFMLIAAVFCQPAVTVHQHLDGTLSLSYGPHRLGHYTAQGQAIVDAKLPARRAVEKTAAAPPWKTLRVSHFPTASTATGMN